MPTLSELGHILTACRVVSAERWHRAARLGRSNLAQLLDALAAEPPEWWRPGEGGQDEPPPGLTDYQRAVIEMWVAEDGIDLARLLARNQFLLLEKLGEGGQGEVYRARQLNPGRFVAVKVLAEESERRRQRFEQEARAMMRVQHPCVARFYLYERVREAGQPTDEYLIAMEFVEGNDLSRLVHALGRLPWPFAVRWAASLLEGLAAIHQNGFIHRDVKPANVMISGPLPEPGASPDLTSAKLLDFGAVKLADEEGTGGRRRTFVGTREYAAPEQWDERTVPESDIYALGATLFHAITGRPPFVVEDRDATLFRRAHAHAPIPDARDFVPEVPPGLSLLLRQMLAKQPHARGSAAELAREFRDLFPAAGEDESAPAKPRAAKPPARRASPESEAVPDAKSTVHAFFHPVLALLERVFLPARLRPPSGYEPPLPERLAALARRPPLIVTLLILIGLLVWRLL